MFEKIAIKIASEAIQATGYVPYIGRLIIDRTPGHEWGYLKIDNVIRRNIFVALDIGEIIAKNG